MKIQIDGLEIAKRIEKIIQSAEFKKKLRPKDDLFVSYNDGSLSLGFDINPIKDYSRSCQIGAFEELVDKFASKLEKAFPKHDIHVDASSSDIDIELEKKKKYCKHCKHVIG